MVMVYIVYILQSLSTHTSTHIKCVME